MSIIGLGGIGLSGIYNQPHRKPAIIKHKNLMYMIDYNDLKISQARNKKEQNDLKKGKRWEVFKKDNKNKELYNFLESFKYKANALKFISKQ